MRPLVVIAEALDPTCANWLAKRADLIWCGKDRGDSDRNDRLLESLPQAQGLIVRTYTQVTSELLDKAPNLKVIARAGVGLDNIDLQACQQHRVQVVYTPDANTQAVVEYVLGLILDALRPRYTLDQYIAPDGFHQLRRDHVGIQLDGLTLGILGFGRIGKRLGKAAHSLGINLLVNDLLDPKPLHQAVDYPFEFVDKPTLYRQSDILSLHVDGRAQNRQMINQQVLNQLKPTCLLLNTARGMLIDPTQLAKWARQVATHGGQAVLDVHDPEPPTPDYPLFGLNNVRLLPHLASRTDQALRNMSWVVKDLWAVLEGQEPKSPAY